MSAINPWIATYNNSLSMYIFSQLCKRWHHSYHNSQTRDTPKLFHNKTFYLLCQMIIIHLTVHMQETTITNTISPFVETAVTFLMWWSAYRVVQGSLDLPPLHSLLCRCTMYVCGMFHDILGVSITLLLCTYRVAHNILLYLQQIKWIVLSVTAASWTEVHTAPVTKLNISNSICVVILISWETGAGAHVFTACGRHIVFVWCTATLTRGTTSSAIATAELTTVTLIWSTLF